MIVTGESFYCTVATALGIKSSIPYKCAAVAQW